MAMKREKAIENLTKLLKQRNEKQVQITTYDLFGNIETVLNMLKEKNEEINKYKKKNRELSNQLLMFYKEQDNNTARIEKKNAELEKKDKIIDLMAEFIEKVTVDLKVAFGENMLWNQNEIKQYFEKKVSD